MELELDENYKEPREDKIYHQKNGAAIITKAAPSNANIFIAGLYLRIYNTFFPAEIIGRHILHKDRRRRKIKGVKNEYL